MTHAHIITVDWGTSHLRAYLCEVNSNHQLTLVDRLLGKGVTKVREHFEFELSQTIAPWTEQYGHLPVLMAGQIGSSIGWKETTYLPCPISPQKVASSCLHFCYQHHQVAIVPGLHCHHDNNSQDVMRSEEVQVLGWLASNPKKQRGKHLICLPGTHTKWVLVKNGIIQLFKTAMTGELYDLLSHHSVLIQSPTVEHNEQAFILGAKYTLESALGNFTHGLFSVRSKQLFNELTPEEAPSYLSGLLIGTDVRAALNAQEWDASDLKEIHIIGNNKLSTLFADVIAMQDIATRLHDVEVLSIQGFSSVYQEIANQFN